MTPIEEQVRKLPRWARDHIENLTRERDSAMRAYNDVVSEQPDSPFYVVGLSPGRGLPETRRIEGMTVGCTVGDIKVELIPGGRQYRDGVVIQFDSRSHSVGRLAIATESSNVIRIVEIRGGDQC